MAAFIVSYGLQASGDADECLARKLEAYDTHWHMLQSVWIIVTEQSDEQVARNLQACLDEADELFVGKLACDASWTGYGAQVTAWLQRYI